MSQINAYLTFNGNCREAMTFYKECLGGELTMQTVGSSPMADQWPSHAQQNILHASLIKGELVLLASDMAGPGVVVKGNTISLSLHCNSEDEIKMFFSNLSSGGQIAHPLHEFFAGMMGALTDKFEKDWLLYYEKKQNQSLNKNHLKTMKIKKSVDVKASKEKVWDVLLNDKFTKIWYAEFSEGTHAETDWRVGSKAVFTDKSNSGLVGKITTNKPFEVISIEYQGLVVNGKEDYTSEEAKGVKGGLETYRLSEKKGVTHLDIEGDMSEDLFESMSLAWDKALQKIKALAESKTPEGVTY